MIKSIMPIQNEIRADEMKKGWFFPQLFIFFCICSVAAVDVKKIVKW